MELSAVRVVQQTTERKHAVEGHGLNLRQLVIVTVFFNLVKNQRINQSKLKQNHKKRETYSEQTRIKDVRA